MNILDIYTGEYKKYMVDEYIKKNQILMSVGEANGNYYGIEELTKGFENTVWDKNTVSVFKDHNPYSVDSWAGWVEKLHIDKNDMKGDIHFVDKDIINKLEAGAQFGISPELIGKEDNGDVKDIVFQNFSVVFEPACKTTYLNSQQRNAEIIIEQAVEPEKGYFYFVNSDGSLCRRKLQSRGYVNMVDKTKKLENETKETETKVNETETTESKIESMLSEVLESQKTITKRLDDLETKEPEGTEEEKKDESEEVTEPETKEEEKSEVKPEETTLSADMYEALREVNADYAEFVREYVSEHKTEGTLLELMQKSSIEFKANKKALEDEDKKKKLQDNKATVTQPDGDDKKKEMTLKDIDLELADTLIKQQNGLAAGGIK